MAKSPIPNDLITNCPVVCFIEILYHAPQTGAAKQAGATRTFLAATPS